MFYIFTKKSGKIENPSKNFFAPPEPSNIFLYDILKKENIKPNVLYFYKKIWKIENPSKKFFRPSRAPQNIFLFDNSQKGK
jgi:hypothetical protein